uniref:Phenylalanine--tRNA ligase beta subunit n=1 Tax=Piliocolobus tephrosceles TaxID=591936 RepID=A0A8C9GQZ4_9PRIM
MPTISVHEDDLAEKLKKRISEKELTDVCFDFGVEIDEVEIKNNKKIYKMEVPANRYDLVGAEGLSRALKNFMGAYDHINYELVNTNNKDECIKKNHFIKVNDSYGDNRCYVVSCVLKNININEMVYNNIIELQEKLHHNIGKKRVLLAIGIHDYDKIHFPLEYKFMEKNKINFRPLNESVNVSGDDFLDFYKNNMHLKPYLHIIKDCNRYSVIVDAKNNILSLPPIINCDNTKLTLDTKNILIECTGTDKNKLEIVLNIICYMLSEYCLPKYTIHSFLVAYDKNHTIEKGNEYIYPLFKNRTLTCDIDYVRSLSGIKDINVDDIEMLLKKMMIYSKKINNNTFHVDIPFYRSDIMHCCDIVEDIVIAYGYSNIKSTENKIVTKHFLNTCSNLFRDALVECTYTEIMTNALISKKENYTYMLREHCAYNSDVKVVSDSKELNLDEYNPLAHPVQILNSKTTEYEIIRTSLIVNLLKFVAANKHRELPLRFFEIGDVAYTAYNKTDTNAINKRYMSVIFADKFTSGFEEIHGVLETVLKEFELYSDYKIEEKKKENIFIRSNVFYKLIPKEDPSFLNERVVDIVLCPHNLKFGVLGIIHPNVLKNFTIDIPGKPISLYLKCLNNLV